MIRTTAVPRPLRTGAAVVGIAGLFALAGCATAPVAEETQDSTTPSEPAAEQTTDTGSGDAGASGVYADGTYTAEGSYATPESVEEITVTVTLESDIVTAVEVVGDPTKRESEQYQGQFIGGIADAVVGKSIDEISVSRIAGSSLTSNGFNQAIDAIKADAAA